LYADSLGGSTDAVARHVSFAPRQMLLMKIFWVSEPIFFFWGGEVSRTKGRRTKCHETGFSLRASYSPN